MGIRRVLFRSVSVEHLSDFGTHTKIGYGANWGPFDALRVQVSFDDAERAPSANQLGDPTISAPNSRIFDYVRGQTVDINRIAGGNQIGRATCRESVCPYV